MNAIDEEGDSARISTRRSTEMLPAIVDVLRKRGPAGFQLGTIAEDLGTSSRMLIYHFGSRDDLLSRVMQLVREQTVGELNSPPPFTLDAAIDRWWVYYMDHLSDIQLFFHLASRRFEEPDRFGEFASSAIDMWRDYFGRAIVVEGFSPEYAAVLGRLVIGALRGITADFLITGDREHVEEALTAFRSLLQLRINQYSATRS